MKNYNELTFEYKAIVFKKAVQKEMKENGKDSAIAMFPEAMQEPTKMIETLDQSRFEEFVKFLGGVISLNDELTGATVYDPIIPNL